ncbi:class I SAM-dependent methyltransferase [Paenibacillus sp. FA6]|uniref:class I SAM-dependent methyltransferase n=1 Tax=Paenibacillus sp. FA6 TaxID=3413029 RepID=UPI003F657B78
MSDSVKKKFDEVAKDYDLQRRKLIPCFDEFYSVATGCVHVDKKTPRILDLGAGTGLFASYVRQRYPEAKLTLIDLSEEMLKEARLRFRDDPQVQYISADYRTYLFDEQSYDAVISSLSIHHLSHQDKRTLFHTVYHLLTDGGIFVNADQAAGASFDLDHRYKAEWEATIRESGLSIQMVESAIERRKLDINASVEDQLKWLLDAGFAEADCVYEYNEFAVFCSRK